MNISAFYIKFRTEMLKTVCKFWKNKVVQYIQNYTKKISKTNKIINKVFHKFKKCDFAYLQIYNWICEWSAFGPERNYQKKERF